MRLRSALVVGVGALVGVAAGVRLGRAPEPPSPQEVILAPVEEAASPPLAELVRAEGLLRLESFAAAKEVLTPLTLHPTTRDPALRLLAWAAFHEGDEARLASLAQTLPDDPEFAFLQDALRVRRDSPAAAPALFDSFWRAPDTAWGWAALRELALAEWPELTSNERSTILTHTPPSTPKLRHQDEASRTLLLQALAKEAPKRGLLRAAIHLAFAHQALHHDRFSQAIQQLRAVKDLAPRLSPQHERARLALLGEAHRRRGDYTIAKRYFDTLAKDDDAFAAQALAAQGEMAIEHRRYDDAEAHFRAQLVLHPVGEARHAALFGLGWVALRTARFDDARRFFRTLLVEAPRGPFAPAAVYWGARALEEAGDLGTARAELLALTQRFGRDYYAHLAHERLRGAQGGQASTLPEPAPNPDVGHLVALVTGGQEHRARAIVVAQADQAARLNDVDLLALRDAAVKLGVKDARGPLERAFDERFALHPDARARLHERYAAHDERIRLLREAAAVRRIAPGVLIAAAEVRAGLNSELTGSRGELGYLQLPRETWVSLWRERHARKTATTNDLTAAPVAAELAARYLSRIVRAFEGRLAYAFAALHAGPGAVTRWREARGDLPEDIFVEEIPYADTRAFVKKTLATYHAYSRLRPQEPATELARASSPPRLPELDEVASTRR